MKEQSCDGLADIPEYEVRGRSRQIEDCRIYLYSAIFVINNNDEAGITGRGTDAINYEFTSDYSDAKVKFAGNIIKCDYVDYMHVYSTYRLEFSVSVKDTSAHFITNVINNICYRLGVEPFAFVIQNDQVIATTDVCVNIKNDEGEAEFVYMILSHAMALFMVEGMFNVGYNKIIVRENEFMTPNTAIKAMKVVANHVFYGGASCAWNSNSYVVKCQYTSRYSENINVEYCYVYHKGESINIVCDLIFEKKMWDLEKVSAILDVIQQNFRMNMTINADAKIETRMEMAVTTETWIENLLCIVRNYLNVLFFIGSMLDRV